MRYIFTISGNLKHQKVSDVLEEISEHFSLLTGKKQTLEYRADVFECKINVKNELTEEEITNIRGLLKKQIVQHFHEHLTDVVVGYPVVY